MGRHSTALFLITLSASLAAGADPSLPAFRDITESTRVDFVTDNSATSRKYLIESMVGGVAMFDYNGDGHLDLFFTNGARLTDPMSEGALPEKSEPRFWDRLYRNNGDDTFSDVTKAAGVQ
ncbi:MAG: VCBS repeat-containing protein, partial [bacterium]|nr:VCBS repeat-containing protein [bacterium]